MESWWAALARRPASLTSAQELYAGEHWTTVLAIPGTAAAMGWVPTLWVASAGYGLVPATQHLRAYAATFSVRVADAVTRGLPGDPRSLHRDWWRALSSRSLEEGVPRSVASLAERSPLATILVVASPQYVDALTEDLFNAREQMDDPKRLVVVTSGAQERFGELASSILPSNARLLDSLGGSRVSLNARVAHDAIAHVRPDSFESDRLRRRYRRATTLAPELETFEHRVAKSDDEVRTKIRVMLGRDPELTATRALRGLRDGGFKCEQKRFGRLFHEVRGAHAN